jgi:hypothetical protein
MSCEIDKTLLHSILLSICADAVPCAVAVLAQSDPEQNHGRAATRHFDALESDAHAGAPTSKKTSPAAGSSGSGHRLRDSDDGAPQTPKCEIADFLPCPSN